MRVIKAENARAVSIGPYTLSRIFNFRFGSKADIGDGATDARFTPKADIGTSPRDVRFVPEADIGPDEKKAPFTRAA